MRGLRATKPRSSNAIARLASGLEAHAPGEVAYRGTRVPRMLLVNEQVRPGILELEMLLAV